MKCVFLCLFLPLSVSLSLSLPPSLSLSQVERKFISDIHRSEGRQPYLVPVGGFSPIGDWGYLQAWEELRGQGSLDNVDDVVVCVGSGGTVSGIALGNYLTGSKVK